PPDGRPHRPSGGAGPLPQRARRGEGMTPEDLCARVLELVDGAADAQVTASAGRSSLTRFANSFIHQNVAEDRASIGLTVVIDGRLASVSTTVTDDDGLHRL